GQPQYNDRRGMPSVVLAPDGTPGVIVPDVAPPSDLAVELLKKGDGAKVTDADTVRVQYTGVGWADREVISSSWEDGASVAVAPGSTEPFAAQLVGATVGSQLLIVIPSTSGDGGTASDASIYVVDILGIDAPTAASR
ncbi:MAG TPA: FKBP-type peptidyl-prolyl cis-trans isomerase, partial [Microbacterium sp.]|nr:FKBP-type peptidyl-prolyl cis-trans isomerase [Microbacterium sp.]